RYKAMALDPIATTRVLGDDPQRLLRIVSVAEETDKPLSQWQAETRPVVPKGYWLGATLLPERSALYGRINARFDHMVTQGGLDEVQAIFARKLSADLPAMRAIGVSQFTSYLTGDMALDAAISLAKRDSRRLAKRQFTWFRGQMKGQGWQALETQDHKAVFAAQMKSKIDTMNIAAP
ncbi:MAG: tRNA (adenosine(37)-N6)-dimethylallyltransferase, partial [Maricaulaceae bacterium]